MILLIRLKQLPIINRIPLPLLIIISIVVILLVVILSVSLYLSALKNSLKGVVVVQGKPSIQAYMTQQNLLYYNESTSFIPYVLLGYSTYNTPVLNFNVTLYKRPLPKAVYILNFSNQCFNCYNVYTAVSSIQSTLYRYGLQYNISVVSQPFLSNIDNNSILIVLNGLLPSFMLSSSNNSTVLQSLLDRGISIVYVGQNFSRLLQIGDIIVPNHQIIGQYATVARRNLQQNRLTAQNPFYFSNATFSFLNGSTYGSATYTNIANGSIMAFSNYLNTWPNATTAGIDIAKSIAQLFWIPRYSSGTVRVAIRTNPANGNIGIILNLTPVSLASVNAQSLTSRINSGHGRAVVSTSSNYTLGNSSVYQYIDYTPSYIVNGNLSISAFVISGTSAYITLQISTNYSTPTYVRPHLSVYSVNKAVPIVSIPLPYTQIVGNFTFIKPLSFSLLAPGGYILSLENFSNNQYAAAYFQVPNVTVALTNANYTSNRYEFYLSALGTPLNQIPYKLSLNGKYQANGTITDGRIGYELPKGLPQIYGNLNFTFDMLSTRLSYVATNPPPVLTINAQYVEIGVVAIIVFILTVFIRAPQIDEFYIDVPNLPRKQVIDIKLSPPTLVSAFDKLNSYYHWRYMPLNPNEVRIGIANSVRYKGMPVNLTFSNVELLLDQMVQRGELANIEYLYAPKQWLDQSSHDIEHLAIFKKLRMYLVTHATVFTDLDASPAADMVVALRDEHVYVVIYSETSKFKKIPVYKNSITYVVFLNAEKLESFKNTLYKANSQDAEALKLYMSSGLVRLLDADNPEGLLL